MTIYGLYHDNTSLIIAGGILMLLTSPFLVILRFLVPALLEVAGSLWRTRFSRRSQA
jgi:hypothetical protein